MEEGGEDYFN